MGLNVGAANRSDVKLDEKKIKGYKNFANKIWNITRFTHTTTENWDGKKPEKITESDKKILDELQSLVKDLTVDMDNYRFYMAAEKLYHYVWHTFADKIIEESKENLKSQDLEKIASTQYMLRHILETSLALLHPFMPFITEEIWGVIPNFEEKKLLMVTDWPK